MKYNIFFLELVFGWTTIFFFSVRVITYVSVSLSLSPVTVSKRPNRSLRARGRVSQVLLIFASSHTCPWQRQCPSVPAGPCEPMDVCPKYSVCKDTSNDTYPAHECHCTMGYTMQKGRCIRECVSKRMLLIVDTFSIVCWKTECLKQ